ncbi:echidna-like protein [Gorgonomyces haynaldii]|nr:echidna-like protein [Gorgonomyces haynaldii]
MADLEAQQLNQNIFQQSSHPLVLFFHLIFKTGALLVYTLGWIVTTNFILEFVLIILLLAFDFWTVKNVTGRVLVGLRWWNLIKDDGTSEWMFEADARQVNPVDRRVFWYALYISPLAWIGMAILAILKFQFSFLVISLIGVFMQAANLVGYTKCEKDAEKNVRDYVVQQGWFGSLLGSMFASRLSVF